MEEKISSNAPQDESHDERKGKAIKRVIAFFKLIQAEER
jgi:hypothetical protein